MPNFRTLFALPFGASHYPAGTSLPPYYDLSIPVSLQTLMALYWRVRDWQVTATRSTPGWPDESYSFTLPSPFSTETDMLTPAGSSSAGSTSYVSSEGNSGTVQVQASFDARYLHQIGDQYSFYGLRVSLGEHYSLAGGYDDSVSISYGSYYPALSSGGSTLTLPGVGAVPLHLTAAGGSGTSATIQVSPLSWWGWGGTYDTATGAAL